MPVTDFKTYKEIEKEGYEDGKSYVFTDSRGNALFIMKGNVINELKEISPECQKT